MKIPQNIYFPKTPDKAIELQQELRHKVRVKNDFGEMKKIAGIDVSYDLKTDTSRSVICLFSYPQLDLLESVVAHAPTDFPYVPGLLSFREIPVLLEGLKYLSVTPDLLMVDGMGIAHPRRIGIAAHLGVLLDLPAIGVGKSLLCGKYDMPGPRKGDRSDLIHKGEKIGTVLRSKDNVTPLFISPGHRIDHETSVDLVLKSTDKYRLPQPTHVADKFSKIRPRPDGRDEG